MLKKCTRCWRLGRSGYADNTIPYSRAALNLSSDFRITDYFKQTFSQVQIKSSKNNPGECHLTHQLLQAQKKPYLESLTCSKTTKKLHALWRIASFMSFLKGRSLMKAFGESQFDYFPLILMFNSRTVKNKINFQWRLILIEIWKWKMQVEDALKMFESSKKRFYHRFSLV